MAGNERFDDSIGRWLQEMAPDRLPQRVLAATFEQTRRSRQHVSWLTVLRRTRRRAVPALACAAAAVAAVAVLASAVLPALVGPATTPSPLPSPTTTSSRPDGDFADVGGWIAFGTSNGIWAVDPSRPADPATQVQLNTEEGTPKAWSADGSKLLVRRSVSSQPVLFVLNADGTETRVADVQYRSGGEFAPDGSQVVYAGLSGEAAGIYVIDLDDGTRDLVLAAGSRWIPSESCPQSDDCVDGERLIDTSVYAPTFSPDGTRIAYFDGNGDWGHSLRVVNRDGTGMRVVLENSITLGAGHVEGLDWSPDGERLVFGIDVAGVFVVGIDGSGPTKVSRTTKPLSMSLDLNPYWSPDGFLISFNTSGEASGAYGRFVIVRPDGTPVQAFDYGQSGPWNPR